MKDYYFDLAMALTAVISALLWCLSARVNFKGKFGYDVAEELSKAMGKTSALNAWAAMFAALAALATALKTFWGLKYGFV